MPLPPDTVAMSLRAGEPSVFCRPSKAGRSRMIERNAKRLNWDSPDKLRPMTTVSLSEYCITDRKIGNQFLYPADRYPIVAKV